MSFDIIFGPDHRYESAKDFQAGLEDKGSFGRYQQARGYLERAQETQKTIEVCRIT